MLITQDPGVWADEVLRLARRMAVKWARGDRGDRIFGRAVVPSVADGSPVLILSGVAVGASAHAGAPRPAALARDPPVERQLSCGAPRSAPSWRGRWTTARSVEISMASAVGAPVTLTLAVT